MRAGDLVSYGHGKRTRGHGKRTQADVVADGPCIGQRGSPEPDALVANAKGERGVVELAAEAGLPVPIASIYLRALNARGLISVRRSGPFVFYGTASDRSLPVSIAMQRAFRRLFARRKLPKDWAARLLPLLKAYANPRREEIVRTVAVHQPIRFVELHRRVGICETSLLRHLGALVSAGVVAKSGNGEYFLAKPANSLSAAFLSAASSP